MVTTRRQSGSKSDLANDGSPALENLRQEVKSASSKKRQRPGAADELTSPGTQDKSTPMFTRKRQKKLPLREKEEGHVERHSHIAVEIPVRDITQENTPMWTASRQGKSGGKISSEKPLSDLEVQETNYQNGKDSEDDREQSAEVIESIEKDVVAPEMTEKQEKESRMGNRVKSKSRSKPTSTSKAVKAANTYTLKPKHKRFDSEEPEPEDIEHAVREGGEVEEEDESSDDGAPDVIATHDAEENARISARSAAKAAKE
jgi:hypothetical protein